jgi:hypothetical protein
MDAISEYSTMLLDIVVAIIFVATGGDFSNLAFADRVSENFGTLNFTTPFLELGIDVIVLPRPCLQHGCLPSQLGVNKHPAASRE